MYLLWENAHFAPFFTKKPLLLPPNFKGWQLFYADVAKLADALDLGSSAARHVGSTPIIRTDTKVGKWCIGGSSVTALRPRLLLINFF
jgi:hypothetical protein